MPPLRDRRLRLLVRRARPQDNEDQLAFRALQLHIGASSAELGDL